jgi:4-amino-4-deoxy-L-arabinose transferase-like glycosyltransferase
VDGYNKGVAMESRGNGKLPTRVFLGLFLLSFILKVFILVLFGPYTSSDTMGYTEIAQNIVEYNSAIVQDDYTSQWRAFTFRMPGYPFFLSLFYRLLGEDTAVYNAVALVQIIMVSFLSMGAAYVTSRFFTSRTAILAGIFAALDPFITIASIAILTDALFSALFGASVVACLLAIERRSIGWAALWGLSLGLAGLVRPIVQHQYIIIILVFVILSGDWRERLRLMIVALMGFSLILGAWSMRNKIRTGYFELETNQGMSMLWHSAYLLEPSTVDDYRADPLLASAKDIAVSDPANGGDIFHNIREQLKTSEHETNEIMVKLAYANIFSHPVRYLEFAANEIVSYLGGIGEVVKLYVHVGGDAELYDGLIRNLNSGRIDLVLINLAMKSFVVLFYGLLFLYGLTYVFRKYRHSRVFTFFVVLVYFYFLAIVSLVTGNPRYHTPMHMVVWVYVSVVCVDEILPFLSVRFKNVQN